MLFEIYARSMLTAARQDCVQLRDLPRPAQMPEARNLLARITAKLLGRPAKPRCINLQNI